MTDMVRLCIPVAKPITLHYKERHNLIDRLGVLLRTVKKQHFTMSSSVILVINVK
jgi:hypothetical protein